MSYGHLVRVTLGWLSGLALGQVWPSRRRGPDVERVLVSEVVRPRTPVLPSLAGGLIVLPRVRVPGCTRGDRHARTGVPGHAGQVYLGLHLGIRLDASCLELINWRDGLGDEVMDEPSP